MTFPCRLSSQPYETNYYMFRVPKMARASLESRPEFLKESMIFSIVRRRNDTARSLTPTLNRRQARRAVILHCSDIFPRTFKAQGRANIQAHWWQRTTPPRFDRMRRIKQRLVWWRRRELNPGPKTFSTTDLHV